MQVATNTLKVSSWRGLQLWLIPLLVVVLFGCKDQYKNMPNSLPPPIDDKNKKFGTLQQVYQQPTLSPADKRTPAAPANVARTSVPLGKNPAIYGDPNAPVTVVEFSDFQ